MHEHLVEDALLALLAGDAETLDDAVRDSDHNDDDETSTLDRASSFEDDGVLTSNRGLVLRFSDGTEFQLTLVQSR